jgi:hypothetical protein
MRKILMMLESGRIMSLPEKKAIEAIHKQGLSKDIDWKEKEENQLTMQEVKRWIIGLVILITFTGVMAAIKIIQYYGGNS